MNLTLTPEWQALLEHKSRLEQQHLRDIFAADPSRFKNFSLELDDLLVDFSKQRLDSAALAGLVALAFLFLRRRLGVTPRRTGHPEIESPRSAVSRFPRRVNSAAPFGRLTNSI